MRSARAPYAAFALFHFRIKFALPQDSRQHATDLIPVSIDHEYSAGPSIRSICTRRRCLVQITMTKMFQVSSNFYPAPAFVVNTRLDKIIFRGRGAGGGLPCGS